MCQLGTHLNSQSEADFTLQKGVPYRMMVIHINSYILSEIMIGVCKKFNMAEERLRDNGGGLHTLCTIFDLVKTGAQIWSACILKHLESF